MTELKYPDDREEIWDTLKKFRTNQKPCKVIIKKWSYSRTDKQNRGFHRILGIIVNYWRDIEPSYLWVMDDAKFMIKRQVGFIKYSKKGGFKIPRSTADANKEEMMMLIEEAQRWGYQDLGIKYGELELRDDERKDVNEYYKDRS